MDSTEDSEQLENNESLEHLTNTETKCKEAQEDLIDFQAPSNHPDESGDEEKESDSEAQSKESSKQSNVLEEQPFDLPEPSSDTGGISKHSAKTTTTDTTSNAPPREETRELDVRNLGFWTRPYRYNRVAELRDAAYKPEYTPLCLQARRYPDVESEEYRQLLEESRQYGIGGAGDTVPPNSYNTWNANANTSTNQSYLDYWNKRLNNVGAGDSGSVGQWNPNMGYPVYNNQNNWTGQNANFSENWQQNVAGAYYPPEMYNQPYGEYWDGNSNSQNQAYGDYWKQNVNPINTQNTYGEYWGQNTNPVASNSQNQAYGEYYYGQENPINPNTQNHPYGDWTQANNTNPISNSQTQYYCGQETTANTINPNAQNQPYGDFWTQGNTYPINLNSEQIPSTSSRNIELTQLQEELDKICKKYNIPETTTMPGDQSGLSNNQNTPSTSREVSHLELGQYAAMTSTTNLVDYTCDNINNTQQYNYNSNQHLAYPDYTYLQMVTPQMSQYNQEQNTYSGFNRTNEDSNQYKVPNYGYGYYYQVPNYENMPSTSRTETTSTVLTSSTETDFPSLLETVKTKSRQTRRTDTEIQSSRTVRTSSTTGPTQFSMNNEEKEDVTKRGKRSRKKKTAKKVDKTPKEVAKDVIVSKKSS